jgi:hypothetical protein
MYYAASGSSPAGGRDRLGGKTGCALWANATLDGWEYSWAGATADLPY